MMQGYDIEAAVPFIAAAIRKAGHKLPKEELEAFARRAIEADMAYMLECGVLTEDGMRTSMTMTTPLRRCWTCSPMIRKMTRKWIALRRCWTLTWKRSRPLWKKMA